MSLLTLSNVKKFYGRQDVLKGAGMYVNPGDRAGLVGANGAGKTTLLRIILGQEAPDEGEVHKAKGLRIGHLPQDLLHFQGDTLLDMVMNTAEEVRRIESELALLAADIEAAADRADESALLELTERQGQLMNLYEHLGGYTLKADAEKILQGLGFGEADFNRPIEVFSGGWIMRAVLARLLLAAPDLLLLDEPTNHLDMDSLLWLEDYLKQAKSALLLVSHDRVFLNNVVSRIIEVERGQVNSFHGNYDAYLEEKERRVAAETAAYENQQERIKQAERFIEKNRVRAATARRAQARIKTLEKMERIEAPTTEDRRMKLDLPKPARGPEILCQLTGVTKSYGDKVVYENLDFSLRRGERIAFLGPNGRGKSTLMKLIAGLTDYQDGRRKLGENVVLSYFAQFQLEELNPNLTVIDELASVAGDLTTGRLRSILGGFLFQGDDVFKKVSVLSGGEKSRLILAKIMLVGPNLLLLDEPTNHLDIPGRDVLETALRQFPGTICLISHDRRLINAVANKVLVIKDRGVESFPGNFDDYMRLWKDRLEQPPKAATSETEAKPAAKTGQTRAEKEARKRKEARARQRAAQQRAPLAQKVRELEQRLDQLAQSLDETAAALADPATYQDAEKSKTLTLKHADLKEAIDAATEKWEQAALQLEELDQAAE